MLAWRINNGCSKTFALVCMHVPVLPCPQVNLINANIDRVSRQHLKQHPRVKMQGGGIWTKESQEWGGLAAELGMCGDEEEDEDSNDDLSDSDDDQGAAFAHVMEAVQAAAAGGASDCS